MKTLEQMINLYNDNGFPVKSFNLFGFRDERDIKKDVINDQLGFFTEKELFVCPGTTDPGVYWTTSAERNKKGTLHLLPGYHERIWTFGKHKGYEALVNDPKKCLPTKGWRDVNYDFVRGPKDIVVCDYFGLNFHRMHESLVAKLIGKYSSGCQVVQKSKDFEYILQRAKDSGLKTFDYALLEV